uniref:Uncharacterized protein n=1 Tax=Phaeomonas parva TaxID=124430 RepID=A0A7S1TQ89_9STRA
MAAPAVAPAAAAPFDAAFGNCGRRRQAPQDVVLHQDPGHPVARLGVPVRATVGGAPGLGAAVLQRGRVAGAPASKAPATKTRSSFSSAGNLGLAAPLKRFRGSVRAPPP